MPTAQEYRVQAKQCMELAGQSQELYVKDALADMAREFDRAAHQAERRARDMRSAYAQKNERLGLARA
jgi:hypothetical protein